ncbi:MAG: sugar phosphate isomerase/epimerase, partial [Armatimonadetes bacterium]|nr:sugar phosphate isomerase/epimerase [Armatimonadota bacterium]
ALEDPYTVTETLAGYTVNLHIKDVRARRDDTGLGVVIQGAPAGQGQVDIPWVIDRVRAAGRDPNAILEQWTPLLDDPRATIDQEARWAEEGIAYLRTLIPD